MKRALLIISGLLMLLSTPVMVTAQAALCTNISDFVPTLTFDSTYYQQQVDAYNAELGNNSTDFELLARRGDAYYSLENFEAAIADYSEAIRINPGYVYGYARLGDAYQQIFDLPSSLAAYNQAIALDPTYAYAYIKRGVLYRKLGEVKAGEEQTRAYILAIADFNTAIELDGTSALAYVRRSELYNNLRQYDLAMADAQTAVELDPTSVFAYVNLGMRHFNLGNYEAAIIAFDQALQFPTDRATDYAYVFSSRAFVCRRLGAYRQAERDAGRAIAFDNTYAYAYLHLGMVHQQYGNIEGAATINILNFVLLYPLDPFGYELLSDYQVNPVYYSNSLTIYNSWRDFSLDTIDETITSAVGT